MQKIKRLWWIPFVLIGIFVAGFVIWAETPLGPDEVAQAAMQSTATVEVSDGDWIAFEPIDRPYDTGLVLYPGGRVDPRSYAPYAQAIASQGYLVVIAQMPLNLAVFSPNLAGQVISAYPQVKTWGIGGHSLGGSMAARYATRNEDTIDRLFLWASYPASNDDLSKMGIEVASIYGTLDGLLDLEQIESSRSLLPLDTQWTVIEGGNHAQFGWYGPQPGDNPAMISHQQQQDQAVQATLELFAAPK